MSLLRSKRGYSVAEVLFSVIIALIVIYVIFNLWQFYYKVEAVSRLKIDLRLDLEKVMEKLKEEVRLSSANYMSMYPLAGTQFTAISFPAATVNANGFLNLESDGTILWDKSVIYHMFTPASGPKELRRTEFTNNTSVLKSASARETQLTNVVTQGDGSLGPNAACATTRTLMEELNIDFKITPAVFQFDGYSSQSIERSDNVDFGCIRLDPGDHTFTFTAAGKNSSSSGYSFGIDTLSITPSGAQREAEYYSGALFPAIQDSMFSGNYYAERTASDIGDSISLTVYYDLFRESNFYDCIRENIVLTNPIIRAQLNTPEDGFSGVWQAGEQTGTQASGTGYNDGLGAAQLIGNITIRNVIRHDFITSGGSMVRVKFSSYPNDSNPATNNDLVITNAFIDVAAKNGSDITEDCDMTSASNRIQLFFRTNSSGVIFDPDTDDPSSFMEIRTSGIVPEGSNRYSNWAIYPVEDPANPAVPGNPKDYFITFSVSSPSYVTYWPGSSAIVAQNDRINSYLNDGAAAAQADWPSPLDRTIFSEPDELPASSECASSRHIYGAAQMDVWQESGALTSLAYDTKLDDPIYNQISWQELSPSGSNISFKARSCDNPDMIGATEWDSVSSTSSSPSLLTIGAGRYVQYKADLSATPYWTCIAHPGTSIADAVYKSGTIICPTCGRFLIPNVVCPWIDDVSIDWPGESKICEISGYFAKKPDYGIIKLTVDDKDLIRAIQLSLTVSRNILSQEYSDYLSVEMEPKNTDK